MRDVPAFVIDLLREPEGSLAYQRAEHELASHPEFHELLEKVALGDSDFWRDAQRTLKNEGLPESVQTASPNTTVSVRYPQSDLAVEAKSPHSGSSDIESTTSQPAMDELINGFLDAPSHPEMLGRFGRYEIENVVGSGGMGIVLRAFDPELHRIVAIKVLAPHLAHSGAARQRFSREAKAAAAVVHSNVIQIHNVDSEAKLPHLVMQFVPGESLQKRIDRLGPLAVENALRIAQQTAAGLQAAHTQGLVHRDVKPANILLEEQTDRVLLSDFGLARAADDASLTQTGIVTGTPDYMSPEQANGQSLDHRSDLFSLGSVLYFMLSGRPPFRADGAMAVLNRVCHSELRPLSSVNAHVPQEVAALAAKCLQKDPKKRPQSAAEIHQELGSLLVRLQSGRLSLPSETHPTGSRWLLAISIPAIAIACSLLFGWPGKSPNALPHTNLQQQEETSRPMMNSESATPSNAPGASLSSSDGLDADQFFDQRVQRIASEILELQNVPAFDGTDQFEFEVWRIHSEINRLSTELQQFPLSTGD